MSQRILNCFLNNEKAHVGAFSRHFEPSRGFVGSSTYNCVWLISVISPSIVSRIPPQCQVWVVFRSKQLVFYFSSPLTHNPQSSTEELFLPCTQRVQCHSTAAAIAFLNQKTFLWRRQHTSHTLGMFCNLLRPLSEVSGVLIRVFIWMI